MKMAQMESSGLAARYSSTWVSPWRESNWGVPRTL
jgi:hypothetical protein